MDEIVLITGASSGIGKATAELLLENGYKVYAGARRLEQLGELRSLGARILYLDVTDNFLLETAVRTIIRNEGRLDILINNAGYGAHGALEDVPMAEARRQFEVNVFGLARLTQLALPHMRRNKSGKIVNISSIAGRISVPLSGWYHASKYAVEAYSDALRLEVKRFGIDVVLIEPGPIKTGWDAVALENLSKNSGSGPYAALAQKLTGKFREGYRSGAPGPERVAGVILKALEARRPSARYVVPFRAKAILFLKWLLPDCVLDFALGSLLR
ncbi:MAG: SDR family NAD(P)-dependent oxidoreductase [Elusimicrobia bacterium]|nr:SDR family NAD(P)-dependent oxidoreductase [Elusimicrobiota bacterium]